LFVNLAGDEMALLIEMVVDLGMNCAEFLQRLHASKPLHGPFSSSKRRKLGAGRASLQFALSPGGIIDLVAVLPFWLAYVLPTDFSVLLVLWMVRFLKLARYSPAISLCSRRCMRNVGRSSVAS
jgi:hypothetical protein